MANTRDLVIRFLADTKQLGTAVSKAEGTLGKLKTAAIAVGGAYAATKVVNFFEDATKAADEDRASQRLLATQIRDTTAATDRQIAGVEKFVNNLSRATGVADDDLRPAYAALVRATGSVEGAQSELATAMDIAAARGVDLATVTTALEKAHNGNVGALGRLGLATKDAAGDTLSLEQIMAQAGRTYKGAAEAAITPSQRWKIATEELKESIGAKLLPVLGKLAEVGANLLAWFDNLSPGVKTAIEVALGLAAALAVVGAAVAVLTPAIAALGVVVAIATSPITLIIVAIAALAAGLIYAYTHCETFRKIVDQTIDDVTKVVTAFVEGTQRAWERWGDTIVGVWNVIAGVVKNQVAAILAIVQPIVDLLHGDWSKAWDDFRARISDAMDGAKQAIGGALEAIKGLIGNLASAIWDFADDIVKALLSIPQRIAGLGAKILKEITGGAAGLVGKVISAIPGFAEGGTVAATGLALVHKGETITPARAGAAAGVGATITGNTIYVQANNPTELVAALQEYARRNGGLRLTGGVTAVS